MDIKEVQKIAENLFLAETGQDLDHLQKVILVGTLQGKTYPEIAKDNGFSESHVKNVGHNLWHILSSALGEKVTKTSFKSIFKGLENNNFSSAIISGIGQNNFTINHVNICPPKARAPNSYESSIKQPQIHLDNAPEILKFYNRTDELSTLETWIIDGQYRLIGLFGISGMGKTALSLQLVSQIKQSFDYIIYRSLQFSPQLENTLTDLLKIFSETETFDQLETKIKQLIQYLQQYRCLIILDDVQMLFRPQKLAGDYHSHCIDYQLFWQQIASTHHQSCLLFCSSEKPREIAQLEKQGNSVKSLILEGLGEASHNILSDQKLTDIEHWQTLVNLYEGNPFWLELTASMIQELFAGKVKNLLQYDSIMLSDLLQSHLTQTFERLTVSEQKLMQFLAQQNQPLTLSEILVGAGSKQSLLPTENLNKPAQTLSPADVSLTIQSLIKRFLLLTSIKNEIPYFEMNQVFKHYWKNHD